MEAKSNIYNTQTSEMDLKYDTGPLLQIRFLEGGGVGGGMWRRRGGRIQVFVFLCHECSTAYHDRLKEEGEDPPGGK